MIKVIKFSASWCGPCKALAPVMDEVKKENPGISFEDVDVDTQAEQTVKFGINAVPTVVVLKNDSEVHRFSGAKPKNVINSILNQYK
jgi:thioredoxin 1